MLLVAVRFFGYVLSDPLHPFVSQHESLGTRGIADGVGERLRPGVLDRPFRNRGHCGVVRVKSQKIVNGRQGGGKAP